MTVKPTKDGKIIESNIVNPTYRTMGNDNLEQKLNVELSLLQQLHLITLFRKVI